MVAARLAASASRSVLLLEAGPDLRENPPDDLRDGWHMTRDHDWGYSSEPDERGEVEPLRRGKLLGGTSAVTRFAVRGSPADYDGWADLGNEGWGFEDVLPYFLRLESDADFGGRPWHGDNGPIPIDRYRERQPTDVGAAALEAMRQVGFPPVEDHNRPGAVGAGRMPMNSRDGIRVTTADAYLPFGGTPPNLTIRSDTFVAEVVFDGVRARGVRLVDGTIIDAGWVVLSAGTYASPSILIPPCPGIPHVPTIMIAERLSEHLDSVALLAGPADHPGLRTRPTGPVVIHPDGRRSCPRHPEGAAMRLRPPPHRAPRARGDARSRR